jgi:hypothetical protein
MLPPLASSFSWSSPKVADLSGGESDHAWGFVYELQPVVISIDYSLPKKEEALEVGNQKQ